MLVFAALIQCRGRMAREGLLLGFAAVGVKEILRGIRELAIVLESDLRGVRRSGSGAARRSIDSRR